MLVELAVRDLGVIEELRLVLGPGMTALTGETGAGKTLVVEAIELLVGGRADPVLVRAGRRRGLGRGPLRARHGRGDEVVLARVVPGRRSQPRLRRRPPGHGRRPGRVGRRLVDLHGQHAHQSLLAPAVQRDALDRFGARRPRAAPRGAGRACGPSTRRWPSSAATRAPGPARSTCCASRSTSSPAPAIDGPDEDERLDAEEATLADAVAHREAAAAAAAALTDDGGAVDALGEAIAAVAGPPPFADARGPAARASRPRWPTWPPSCAASGEGIEEDPARLEALRARRQLLHELRRKYGDTLADVLAYARRGRRPAGRARAATTSGPPSSTPRGRGRWPTARPRPPSWSPRPAARPRRRWPPRSRSTSAPLAMERARVEVAVRGRRPADDVAFLLAANPGSPPLPLAKVASGGELARAMLALRLVLDRRAAHASCSTRSTPASAARPRSRSGARSPPWPRDHQVLVVTHLPQVAAFADAQVSVTKESDEATTVAHVAELDGDDRVVELSRMLSGQPDSRTAREHAEELLAAALHERGLSA